MPFFNFLLALAISMSLLRQRRGAAGKGLSTTIKYLRQTTSGAAGNGLGTTAKYLRRTTSGSAGNCLTTKIKYMRGAAGICLGTTIKYLRCTSRHRLILRSMSKPRGALPAGYKHYRL